MLFRRLDELEPTTVSHNRRISKRVFLGAGELPHLTNLAQAVFRPGDSAPGHSHDDMWEVFLVRSGKGVIRVDGQETTLAVDDCCVVAPGEKHELENTGSEDLHLLYFGLKDTKND